MTRLRRIALPVVVAALGCGGATYAVVADAEPAYRTATASVADVAQTLSLTGTVSDTGRADLAFGADGEVTQVVAEVGDRVEEGQRIGVLDRTSLRADLTRARADLAAARAQLETDEDAQADTVAAATEGDGSGATSSGGSGGTDSDRDRAGGNDATGTESGGTSSNAESAGGTDAGQAGGGSDSDALRHALADLEEQQTAVTEAKSAATTVLGTADAALTTQQEACAIEATPTETDGPDLSVETPMGEPSEDTANKPNDEAGRVSEACRQALWAVQSAQAEVQCAQEALQTSLETLGDTLSAAAGVADSTVQPEATTQPETTGEPSASLQPDAAQHTDSPSTSGTTGEGVGDQQSGGDGLGRSEPVTAATLAQDQAAIDEAEAAVVVADNALDAAVVRAPVDGEIVSLSVEPGEEVTAGTTIAVLIGDGLTTVDLGTTAAQARQLRVGQAASVTPVGSDTQLDGTVSRIQRSPEDIETDSSATVPGGGADATYPVTITLADHDGGTAIGATVGVAVATGEATDVVTVPTSAVSAGVVTVLDGEEVTRVRVTTGIVGASRTEIVDGLDDGVEVVLADLDADLPSGDDTRPPGLGGGAFSSGRGPA